MKRFRFIRSAAVALACVGLMVPQTGLRAEDNAAATQSESQVRVANFELSANGSLAGTVVTKQGTAVDGGIVTVRQGANVVAKTTTAADGSYTLQNLKGGDYVMTVGQQAGVVHFWAANTAPPKAPSVAKVIVGNPVVRGQEYCPPDYCPPGGGLGLDFITLWTVGAATAAALLAGITLSKVNDIEDCCESLQSP